MRGRGQPPPWLRTRTHARAHTRAGSQLPAGPGRPLGAGPTGSAVELVEPEGRAVAPDTRPSGCSKGTARPTEPARCSRGPVRPPPGAAARTATGQGDPPLCPPPWKPPAVLQQSPDRGPPRCHSQDTHGGHRASPDRLLPWGPPRNCQPRTAPGPTRGLRCPPRWLRPEPAESAKLQADPRPHLQSITHLELALHHRLPEGPAREPRTWSPGPPSPAGAGPRGQGNTTRGRAPKGPARRALELPWAGTPGRGFPCCWVAPEPGPGPGSTANSPRPASC